MPLTANAPARQSRSVQARHGLDLADIHLVLFFTRGVSLRAWAETGMLEREVALYRRLRPRLRALTFVTYGDASDLDYGSAIDGISVVCNRWSLPLAAYRSWIGAIRSRLWRRPTIVKTNQIPGAELARAAATAAQAHFVARCGYLHSEFMDRRFGVDSAVAREASIQERDAFVAADRIVVTTPAMRASIHARYGIADDRIAVITNYVDTERFRPLAGRSEAVRRAAFVGRLEPQKNPVALVEALAGLGIELVVMGDGPLRQEMVAAAEAGGVRIDFRGNVRHDALPAALNDCDLFILPSLYEGHPKALLEAMACGLPVVGAATPGIREVITDGADGILCGTESASIRTAVVSLAADPAQCKRLGAAARETVLQTVSLSKVAELEIALLHEVAHGPATGMSG